MGTGRMSTSNEKPPEIPAGNPLETTRFIDTRGKSPDKAQIIDPKKAVAMAEYRRVVKKLQEEEDQRKLEAIQKDISKTGTPKGSVQ